MASPLPSAGLAMCELQRVVRISSNGTPVYPPIPFCHMREPVRRTEGALQYFCYACERYCPYDSFDLRQVAIRARTHRCDECVAAHKPVTQAHSRIRQRMTYIDNKGKVRILCSRCGRYRQRHHVNPSRVWTRRLICIKCHAKHCDSRKRTSTGQHRRRAWTDFGICSKCGMSHPDTGVAVCAACINNLPPVALVSETNGYVRRRNINATATALAMLGSRSRRLIPSPGPPDS